MTQCAAVTRSIEESATSAPNMPSKPVRTLLAAAVLSLVAAEAAAVNLVSPAALLASASLAATDVTNCADSGNGSLHRRIAANGTTRRAVTDASVPSFARLIFSRIGVASLRGCNLQQLIHQHRIGL
jgi:hypothetical protein